jgi:hypothetical protein
MRTKIVYISGGEGASPSGIKSALDEIRKTLSLPADVVLFGIPADLLPKGSSAEAAAAPADAKDFKVLQFPEAKKKSILNVIKNPEQENKKAAEEEIVLPDGLLLDGGGADETAAPPSRSITDLMGEMPGMDDDEPKKQNIVEEFGDFLSKEALRPSEPKKIEKTPRPFGRKGRGPLNLLGDLFSYAGMAANDDVQDFVLPDFIKRP